MAIEVQSNTPLAQAIQDAVQPKLIENGWVADESDITLAEYVVTMLARGCTRSQIITELGNDLLGVGEDDPAVADLADWLFQQIPFLDAQLSGKAQALQDAQIAQHTAQQSTQQEVQQPVQQLTQQATQPVTQDSEMQMDDAMPSTAPSGPKAMRDGLTAGSGRGRGRMLGQLNRQMDRNDDKMIRIKGAAGGGGRINTHAARDSNRRGRGNNNNLANSHQRAMGGRPGQQFGGMPTMNPQQQEKFMQLMDMQNQMMAQMLNGQAPNMAAFNPAMQNSGKSLFDRVERARPNTQGHRQGSTNGSVPDIEMGEGKEPFDTLCRFNDKCTVATCPFAHQSPAAPAGTPVDLTDSCSFGAACENRKCAGKHPSPAQRRQHLSQEVDCKFYPNCTNPACPFRHPDMPPCRNGADCTTPDCKFSHSKIMCRYTPCLNPACVYKHVEGQKRTFQDKVWKRENGTAERLKTLGDHEEQSEELIIPGKDAEMQVTEQAVEIIT